MPETVVSGRLVALQAVAVKPPPMFAHVPPMNVPTAGKRIVDGPETVASARRVGPSRVATLEPVAFEGLGKRTFERFANARFEPDRAKPPLVVVPSTCTWPRALAK